MRKILSFRDFSLPANVNDLWCQHRTCYVGEIRQGVYIPRLNYVAMSDEVDKFRLLHRTEDGQRLPKAVDSCLRTLAQAINKTFLSKDTNTERIRLQNALIELKNAVNVIDDHGLPEPRLLTIMQIRMSHAYNDLDPGQSQSRHH